MMEMAYWSGRHNISSRRLGGSKIFLGRSMGNIVSIELSDRYILKKVSTAKSRGLHKRDVSFQTSKKGAGYRMFAGVMSEQRGEGHWSFQSCYCEKFKLPLQQQLSAETMHTKLLQTPLNMWN
jgi:hypothetical protein